MPEIIDQEVERFLYLDADMVINKNLEGLFKLDIQDKIFAAVHDIAAVDWKMYVKHHIPENYLYFNSGVLLIDRKKWIDLKFTQKVIQYLSENMNICDYHDQDGLNGALYEYRYPLSPIWNQQIGIFFIHPALIKQVYGDEYIKAKKCPAIIHFNGLEKPWYNVSKHPWSKKFKLYADKVTDFSYTDHHSLKKWIKKNLVYNIFGWKNVNKYFYYSTRLKY
jgi:lipopolysaccharide biosynthesis glycosyltransferase